MTTTELGASWSERLNPRNWSLAWKLIAIGLVPALLALALGVLRISDQAGDAATLGTSNRLLEIRGQVAGAADALRQERDEATLFVAAGRTEDRGVLDIGIGQTDADVQEAVDAVAGAGADEFDTTTRNALTGTQEALGQLGALRTDVATSQNTGPDQVVDRYSAVIARVDGLERALLRQLRTPDVAGLADALTATTSAGEQLAVQHTVLGAAIRAGQLLDPAREESVAADNRLASAYSDYQVALTPEQLAAFGTFDGGDATGALTTVKQQILATPPDRPVVVDPAQWDAAYATALAAVQESGSLIRDDMVARSTAAEERASNLAGINSVILMLGLLAGITIAILVARALVRSLRVLRTAALDVAERRLPQAVESMRAGDAPDVTVDPVPLNTRDEVGQVARAFDAVHGQAIRLAADQAALQTNVSSMFVNLSRRSQALVERQLQLIEQLESNEQDPDQLSNLFQLDHLATRMRRNSENLLVLAGTDLAKRNIAPVPMVDVLRAAVSEIEQYQRIVVQAPPTTTIVGRAASDLVHLLAELLDNATNFSPPDSQVVMSTTRTAEGDILVEISDRGVGMIDFELADANQRLGGPSAVDVSASRRMGLFVVGRLGARHDIQVQLSTSSTGGAGTGLTASVTVPAQLVPTTERELARPVPAVAQGGRGPSAFDVPPQRGTSNGNGRSLSALVAGTDGPSTPASAFDPGPGGYPPVNGSAAATPSLPTRRPGSSLHPDGPSVAEQARQDQLAAAERSRQERSDQDGPGPGPDDAGPPVVGSTGDGSDHDRADHDAADHDAADRDAADTAAAGVDTADHGAAAQLDGTDDDTATTAYAIVAPREQPAAEADRARHVLAEPDEDEHDAAAHDAADEEPGSDDRPADPSDDADSPDDATSGPATGPAAGAAAAGAVAAGAASDGHPAEERTPANGAMPRNPWPQGAPPHAPQPPTGRPFAARPPVAQPPAAAPAGSTNGNGAAPHTGNGTAPTANPAADLPAPPALPQRRPSPVRPPAAEPTAPATAPIPVSRQATPPAPPTSMPPAPPAAPSFADAPGQEPADGLFAPSTPAQQTEAPAAPADAVPTGRPEGSGFELGETTPIFEEIASAWFRSNRPLPVDWEAEARSAGPSPQARPRPAAALPPSLPVRPARPVAGPPPVAPPTPGVQPSAAPLPSAPQPSTPQPSTPQPSAQPSSAQPPAPPAAPLPSPVQAAPPVRAQPPVQPRPAPAAPPVPAEPAPVLSARPEASAFSTSADEGWLAANNAAPVTDRPDEVTAAGLPKRRPRARLVPGSAGSAVLAPPVSPARSAESVRGRLASYQQGVRQGRESRYRGDANGATESANAGGNHDEERQ
ncbi:nitrate- and nitrite sensing domain-containing protein [Pseudonocardia petroleophila]|uniref:histidine kinase n=1 Tax=Pseudonocardia petroleophila TaxID=37331 RepID=A0A7G7MNG0_9PSEU|nr:nitrate- and nitrite sensing domain-containing protein [Pseudonocardia petroleophila]QNG54321.1 nitrate- and nitrite sensing domain-containing protein [Pseudonocardia petroleophila]